MNTNTNTNTNFKYLDLITGLFAILLIVSNLCSTRIIEFGPLTFDAGTLVFPLTYIFNDLLTEVYGYKRSRRVIWIGFLGLGISAISLWLVSLFPSPAGWDGAVAWGEVMGQVPRLVIASLLAYLIGEFVNSYTLAKLKVKNKGNSLGYRLIASTVVGQMFDTIIFASIAFLGVLSFKIWLALVVSNYVFKVLIEVIFLPLTILIVKWFKKTENIDVYDKETNFSPFKW